MTISCSSGDLGKDPQKWSEKQLNEWYESTNWKRGWNVLPDESLDRRELAFQFFKNTERWKKAFEFLSSKDLRNIPVGTYKLEGNDLFVMIQNYITKDEENTSFETHQKYADIQHVIEGEEKIGIMPLEKTTSKTAYDQVKDIRFLESGENNYKIANSERFFIFFPKNAHRPSVRVGERIQIKKVVVKVRIN